MDVEGELCKQDKNRGVRIGGAATIMENNQKGWKRRKKMLNQRLAEERAMGAGECQT